MNRPDIIHAARAIVKRHLHFLETLSYSPPQMSETDDPLLGYVISACFSCPSRDRSINLSFVPSRDEEDPVATLHIYRKETDTLSLDVWLAKRHPHLRAALDQIQADQANLIEFMDLTSGVYAQALQGPARGIVDGTSWEEGMFVEWT